MFRKLLAAMPLFVAIIALVFTRRIIFGFTVDALLFYLVFPIAVLILLRSEIKGLGLGDWKTGLLFTAVGVVLSVVVVGLSVHLFPSIRSYYASEALSWLFVMDTLLYMLAWEYLFRGYLLFGLKDFGFWPANVMQTVLFFLAHLGKPPIELWSTALTGLIFGYVAWRSKAIWPMVLIHTAIYLSVVGFAG